MISDVAVRADIQAKWNVVRELTTKGPSGALIPGAGYINFEPRDPRFCNLPLLLAYAALEQVLEQLVFEGIVPEPAGKRSLYALMCAAQQRLPWSSYATIDEGRNRRNSLAHDAVFSQESECLRFIEAIDHQLRSWGIVE